MTSRVRRIGKNAVEILVECYTYAYWSPLPDDIAMSLFPSLFSFDELKSRGIANQDSAPNL